MNGELFGIGRTWLVAVLVIVGTTIMFGMNKITADVWKEMTTWALTVAGGKSALVGAVSAIKK